MATTSRKRKKVEEKEQKPAITAQKVEEKAPNTLHSSHILALEVGQRDIENAKLLMAVDEQALRNYLLEKALLETKIEKQKILVAERAKNFELEKKKFETRKKEIWPQYGLGENDPLGYDSISGEIVVHVK